jgi:hypothetical protein
MATGGTSQMKFTTPPFGATKIGRHRPRIAAWTGHLQITGLDLGHGRSLLRRLMTSRTEANRFRSPTAATAETARDLERSKAVPDN